MTIMTGSMVQAGRHNTKTVARSSHLDLEGAGKERKKETGIGMGFESSKHTSSEIPPSTRSQLCQQGCIA